MRTGAVSSFGIAFGIALACLTTASLAETAAPAPAPAQSKPAPAAIASQWTKVCDPNNAKLCQVTAEYSTDGGASLLGSISVQTSPDPNKFAVGIQVPLGFIVQVGVPLTVDGTKKATAPFITCLPSPQGQTYFCLAQTLVDGAFIDTLKKGKKLDLALFTMDKTSTTMSFPLDNFGASFDGPDQSALARQRDDAAKVLAEKAKERAKQLEGQQPKP
jgi:invasion protein IalB